MVPVDSVRVSRAPTYSGYHSRESRFRLQGLHLLRLTFQCHSTISFQSLSVVLLPPARCWFGLLRFRSPLLSESLLFSSPPGTKMFQFPGLPSLKLCIGLRMIKLFNFIGFPHSDTPGSLPVYDSPRRFAVICVLLLLYMPRHPPYALTNLITYIRLCFTRTVNYFVLDFLS